MNTKAANNLILASLPQPIYEDWERHFEEVELLPEQVLYAPGTSMAFVYFPLTAIVSWQYLLENGGRTEVAMVGREGLVGMFLLMSDEDAPNQRVVQTVGRAIRIPLSVVLSSFQKDTEVHRILMSCAQTLINQLGQSTVCHQQHSIEQRLCRMLLMILDRQDSLHLYKTHEALSQLLGVRREAISLAANKVMKDGVINYSRGFIEVLDRPGLEQRVCSCYKLMRLKR